MVVATALEMGVSTSLLSATPTTTTIALVVSAGCFALGYLLAFSSSQQYHDDEDRRRGTSRRFLCWARSIATRGRAPEPADERTVKQNNKKKADPLEIEGLADILEDFKMVLVVRNDLKMGKGKIAAQCSHATLGLYKKLLHRAPKSLSRWEMCGQVKVVLKIESEEDMLLLQERAKSLKLPTHVTIDAGRTQIAPNSMTVMAVLGPADVVDDVTGGLKLL